jgi:hypothetical protein
MATSPKHLTVVRHPSFLSQATALRDAGFAIHWLQEKSKAPAAGLGWPELPVATIEQLKSTYRDGLNVGLRTGEPSHVAGMYAHVFDVDIRFPDLADEAWQEFDRMFPGIRDTLPCVVSGSGGESRHLHFLTDKPFYGRKLAVSKAKHRTANGGWTYNWEIDLFGTGRQVAMPPSMHPDTGIAYRWEREYDLDGLEFGGGPIIDSDVTETLGIASTGAFNFEACPPKTFDPGQMESELNALSLDILDDRAKWVTLGQALHHQFGGAQEGFDLWMRYSAKSESHLKDSSLNRELRRYRGFGRNRRQPVTMATIRSWYLEERDAANLAFAIAELDDLDDVGMPVEAKPTSNTEGGEFDELLKFELEATDLTNLTHESVFDIELTDTALDWKTLLAISEKGSIEANLHNLRLIIENDKRTAGVMAFNEFSQEIVQRGTPGVRSPNRKNQAKPFIQLMGSIWTLRDRANGDFWTAEKDSSIRAMIEAPKTQGGYGIKVSDRDLQAAIELAGHKICFHPVREYLSAQQWDGTPRVERLFIDYLGAPDDAYGRDTARLMMIAGVARIFEPGCKWDYVVILQGLQGKRKSTFISTLAKNWAAELEGDMTDTRAMVEAMQKAWILEIPELAGFTRADVRHIKGFVSRQTDKVRLAYAKRAQEYRRQSIFCGSTNDFKFLKDDTGNRRFWPIGCHVESIDIDRLRAEVDQLWAEAVVLYQAMRAAQPFGDLPLYLTGAAAQAIALQHQESAQVESADEAQAGQIGAWLDAPIISGSVDDDRDVDGKAIVRSETCLLEIWVDCLKKDRGLYNQQTAQMLGRAMRLVPGWTVEKKARRYNREYGLQRVIVREVETPP